MSYYLVGDTITETPGGYGPIDLDDLRRYLRTKAEYALVIVPPGQNMTLPRK